MSSIISSDNGGVKFFLGSFGVGILKLDELWITIFLAYFLTGLSEDELLWMRFFVYAGELSSETDWLMRVFFSLEVSLSPETKNSLIAV